jgi:hypothetical protein
MMWEEMSFAFFYAVIDRNADARKIIDSKYSRALGEPSH